MVMVDWEEAPPFEVMVEVEDTIVEDTRLELDDTIIVPWDWDETNKEDSGSERLEKVIDVQLVTMAVSQVNKRIG